MTPSISYFEGDFRQSFVGVTTKEKLFFSEESLATERFLSDTDGSAQLLTYRLYGFERVRLPEPREDRRRKLPRSE